MLFRHCELTCVQVVQLLLNYAPIKSIFGVMSQHLHRTEKLIVASGPDTVEFNLFGLLWEWEKFLFTVNIEYLIYALGWVVIITKKQFL